MIKNTFKSTDGKSTVAYFEWEVEKPKAVLQIIHGMSEYILRYEAFAKYLNENGIAVVGNDHIGHGSSADPKDYGYFGPKDGWIHMYEDAEVLHQIMKEKYKDVPYFIMGHSMGSFIIRAYLAKYGRDIEGAIIMGTAGANPALGAGKALVSIMRKLKGDRYISKLVTAMAFGSYSKRIPSAKTYNDWLTRDDSIVEKYIADPACGFTFTLAGYADLFNVLTFVNSKDWYGKVEKDLPILIVAGMEDPVGAYGAGPAEVCEGLEDAGCSDVSLLLYEGMRHEILNEFGKETVYDDIRRFILDDGEAE